MTTKDLKPGLPFDVFIKKAIRHLIKINFKKKEPLILINGVAEQYESWYFNVPSLNEEFVVHWPNLYLFDSDNYLRELQKVSVEWMAKRLETYLDSYVQTPPYHLVGSSAGGQTAVTYAAGHPEKVSKLILICPSGLGGDENFPVIQGVSKRDLTSMIGAIFYDRKNFVIDEIVQLLRERFDNKKWRLGFVRMAQVTKKNSILEDLVKLKCPVLFICGEEDQIIPIWQAYRAVQKMRDAGCNVRMIVIPKCGHAPQIERSQIINKYISDFIKNEGFVKNSERFLKQQAGLFIPFDLDRAAKRALPPSQAKENVLEHAPVA